MASKQRYQVIQKIDAGGMAEIYKGKGLSLQGIEKTVAIKRILPTLTQKPKFVTMFLDEARLSMRLNHANIVQVFDVGRSGGTYFLIMEYVEGVNVKRALERVMERGERVPVPVALFVAAEICKGLSYAHGLKDDKGEHLGIVHRDISPSNILFSMSGEVKITDFGLARAVTHVELTDPGIIKGKFSYLCPEALLEDSEVDHRADIFSLGIILWEMLAGRRLFVGDTDAAILDLIEHSSVPSLRKLNPDVPFEVEEIIGRALAKNPEGRYSNANAMGDAILDVLFRKGLKVSASDLSDYVKRLQTGPIEGEAPENPFIRIQSLIKEEILNLSMVGSGPSGVTGDVPPLVGANPLSDASLSFERMKGASQFKDIWDVKSVKEVSRDDLFADKASPAPGQADDGNRAAMFWLGGLTAVFLILLAVYFFTT